MSCPSRDDLVGYALGALEPGEEKRIAKHAGGCEPCAAELRRLAPAVGVLAESVQQVEPPESLRQSVMAIVHSEAAPSSGRAPVAPRRQRVRGFLWRPAAAIGVTALLAAGAVGYAVRNGEESAERIMVEGMGPAGGTLVVEGGDATLHAAGMSALPKGAVYQVWVVENGATTPSATFIPRADGSATAAVPEVADGASEMLVTRESRPGRRNPTLPFVLGARID